MTAAIVLSKNSANLKQCLAAWFASEPDSRCIVVDDGLDVRAEDDRVEYLSGEKPFIFARNANIGIRRAIESGFDHIVLLNDDALIVTDRAIGRMIETWPSGVGLGAPTCTNVGNRRQFPRGLHGWETEPRMVCFTCAVLPASTIGAVGLLDESFDGYGFEDDDYCLRVRLAGLKIGIFHDAIVDHGSLRSTFRPSGRCDMSRGMQRFIQKWGTHPL